MTLKIVVFGATGLLGSSLVTFLNKSGNQVITIGRSSSNQHQCNILNQNEVDEVLMKIDPDVILNLVALTDVDFCEKNPHKAFEINVNSVKTIVEFIKKFKNNTRLIHISSDQLYNGVGPHSEENISLTNYYAFSKYAGELIANTVPSLILRTNFFGKSNCINRTSFSDWLYKNISDKNEIFLFDDVLFSPLSIQTLCEKISSLISSEMVGIFNIGSNNGMSKADFAFLFANNLNLKNDNMKVISISDAKFIKTYRPKDMRLNLEKIETSMLISLPILADEITRVCKDYE